MNQRGALLRILGVGFGIAVVVGGTVGVGILRTPGEVDPANSLTALALVLAGYPLYRLARRLAPARRTAAAGQS
jgi:hypothetical protein